MSELKVMTLGRQLSLVHSSKNSKASFQSPAFSQALIRLLYVITLLSQPYTVSSDKTCCFLTNRPPRPQAFNWTSVQPKYPLLALHALSECRGGYAHLCCGRPIQSPYQGIRNVHLQPSA